MTRPSASSPPAHRTTTAHPYPASGRSLSVRGAVACTGGVTDPLDAVPEPVFPVCRAVAAGLVTSRARRPDLVAAGRGLRRRRNVRATSVQIAVAHAQRDRSLIVSHASAAALWDLWLPSGMEPPPQLSRLRPAAQPRMAGVEGHRLRLDPAADLVVLGAGGAAHAVTSPVRTWLDLAAAGLCGEDLVIFGDALLRRADGPRGRLPPGWGHPLASPDEVRAAVDGRAGRPGGRALRDALPHLRAGSDSPQETRLRLRLVRAGLPEPRVNPRIPLVWDAHGRVLRSIPVDLYFEAARVAVQYEGEHHFTRADQYRRDMRRDEELRDVGVETLRVDGAVFGAAEWQRFLARVRRVLRDRGVG